MMAGIIVPEHLLKTHKIAPIEGTMADLRKLLRPVLQADILPHCDKLVNIDFNKEYECCVSKLFN
ncbi:hypothetical protein PR048_009008 [Dryococelus australis]|uniref:Uncharacterized protein n=1 Tax=Dryococelus australis TaxID=614101 RepID=A0ABQ9HZL0_9NEOP|nr:hypothetical protein PR048_009008 [Dryococelus australis]